MIQQPNSWQALGDVVARLVEKEKDRQRANAPVLTATNKGKGDE